jgi:hypothetical protein
MRSNWSAELPHNWGDVSVPRPLWAPLVALAIFAPLLLYRTRLTHYTMYGEDPHLVADALTWDATVRALWEPVSTHVCPPFRLLTRAIVSHADRLHEIPGLLRVSPILGRIVRNSLAPLLDESYRFGTSVGEAP